MKITIGSIRISILILFLALSYKANAQEKYTISGTVKDAATGETLIGVNVIFPDLIKGTTTNEYGYFSISLAVGTHNILIDYMGYTSIKEIIVLDKNIKKNYEISENMSQLDEVVISTSAKTLNIRKAEVSSHKLTMKDIKKIPVVLGEVDLIKTIQLLPGVTNGGEGSAGFNVRGGAADQNMIMLDEAVLYNSDHVFGFVSVFNGDAIKNLKLYKGGIPAQFGGRASSVLDVHQKDGNAKEMHIQGGVGVLSSRLLVEGPIGREEKGSFIVAGRSSYVHLFFPLSKDLKGNKISFYDLNAKLSYSIDEENKIFLSSYFGRDVLAFGDSFANDYGNFTLSLRWNHLFTEKLFSNLSFIHTDYSYNLDFDYLGFSWQSGIKNTNFKYDFKYYVSDDVKVDFGINSLLYEFNPGAISPFGEGSVINEKSLDLKKALESALYISVKQDISDKISVNYGLRYSMFSRLGGEDLQLYENNMPVTYDSESGIYQEGIRTDVKQYGKSESIATFGELEPRLAISFRINDDNSFKFGYNRMAQYIHLISNSNSPTPLDNWAPSGKYIKPQIANQYNLGYYTNIAEGDYSLETEVYYKTINNRLDYIDGSSLIAQENIETQILSGEARSYGLELMFKKNKGKFTGWVSYTLSRAEQKVEGRTAEESGIVNGNWYKSNYDKTHNLSVVGSYNYSKKWSYGFNFTYETGSPTTYPSSQYVYQDVVIPNYSDRNEDSLPDFHHLDISMTYNPSKNKGRKWKAEWVFSVYNVYGRENANSISFRQNETTRQNEAVQLSIFGLIPSVTYNFKF